MVDQTIKKDYYPLTKFIHPDRGIYIDLKGFLTLEDFKKELKKRDNYFSIFFFDTDLLIKEKKSKNVRTVRDLLLLAGELYVEIYYESNDSIEVKIRFKDSKEFESELNNPYFIKVDGKWYINRLF